MLEQSGRYTDRVVESDMLNGLLVLANNVYAFLYRNIINAPLMSKKSMRIRQELLESDSESEKNGTKFMQDAKLGVSRKNKILFNVQFFVQVLLVLRFMAVCSYLNDYYPSRRLLVSYVQPSGSMFYESTKINLPVRVTPLRPPLLETANESSYIGSYVQSYNSPVSTSENEVSCGLGSIERFYTKKYGQFYLWNSSQQISTNEHIKYLLLEQHLSLQMLSKEVAIYNYLMGCMMATCGIFGCWLAARRPYDIMPLVFIYEPKFISAYTKQRLVNYLHLVHQSYKNFWSSFALDWQNELTYHAHSCWTCSDQFDSLEDDAASVDIDKLDGLDIRVDERQFRSYTPTARSQAWRRLLIIVHPFAQFQQTFVVFSGILALWLRFIYQTDVEKNASLSAFLGTGDTTQLARPAACGSVDPEVGIAVRESILTNYARGVRENKFTIDRLAPVDFPPPGYWLLPLVILALSSQVITLYLMAFSMTIIDLCFWLVELRLKLNVCISLLRHRQEESAREEAKSQLVMNSILGLHDRMPPPADLRSLSPGIASRACFSAKLMQTMLINTRSRHDRDQDVTGVAANSSQQQIQLCNIKMSYLGDFLSANRAQKESISNKYAQQLINLDSTLSSNAVAGQQQQAADNFLLSTYLDLRLFLDQIDDCRSSLNIMIGFSVFHALNIIGASTNINDIESKLGFMVGGFLLGNVGLLGAAFFQSQCSKLYGPIHSMLALSARGDRTIRHLALLWRRSLVDFTGPKSKFSFTIYSMKITYASVLQRYVLTTIAGQSLMSNQFNLSLISLYILVLDKNRTEH